MFKALKRKDRPSKKKTRFYINSISTIGSNGFELIKDLSEVRELYGDSREFFSKLLGMDSFLAPLGQCKNIIMEKPEYLDIFMEIYAIGWVSGVMEVKSFIELGKADDETILEVLEIMKMASVKFGINNSLSLLRSIIEDKEANFKDTLFKYYFKILKKYSKVKALYALYKLKEVYQDDEEKFIEMAEDFLQNGYSALRKYKIS
ncbi:hypothetical protein ACFL21_05185 [Patescibacteria group bacterium]